jgi:thiamine monophosphate synthase
VRLHVLVEEPVAALLALQRGATAIEVSAAGAATDVLVERWHGFATLDAIFVVRDDVDAAVALGADGVHLSGSRAGVERARARGLLLGLSAASAGEALVCEASGADYVVAAHAELAELRAICGAVAVPVVAAGPHAPAAYIAAGAYGVATTAEALEREDVRAAVDAAVALAFDPTA